MAAKARIAIIGAGNVGGNLGTRLAQSGYSVRFGVKEGTDVKALLDAAGPNASSGSVADAAKFGDIAFLAVPANVALDVARSLADTLAGKTVVDCNNPLTWKDGPIWAPTAEGSLAASIAKAVPNARVVKGFNTFGAEHHKEPGRTGAPVNVFLASDDTEAKKAVTDVAKDAGFAPVDAGPLRNAAVLENVAMLWIHLGMVGGQGRDFVLNLHRAK
jgi:NADPH-dependent F420 reductase